VEEFAQDIRRHLDNLPIHARPESLPYRARKFVRRNRAPVIASGAAVLVTALLATGVVVLGETTRSEPSLLATGALAPRDRVLVAPLIDRMGDTLLTAAVGEAFRIDLTQSPFIQVLTPLQVRSALERMQLPADAVLSDSLAHEVALREGAKAVVTGTLARLGAAYTINLQLVSVERGEALAAVRESARDSTQLLAAVDRASKALRQRLGESVRQLRDMPSLEQVTTPSLAALRTYSTGYRHYLDGDRTRAIALFSEAVAQDTGFASAYSAMAYAYAALAEPGRSLEALDHAAANRDRLPFLQGQMLLASRAYSRSDYRTSIAEYERLLERYPNHVPALNNLALAYRDTRRYAEAERLWHRAIELDSTISVLYFGLHSTQAFQGKRAHARRTLDIIARRFPDDPVLGTVEVQDAAARRAWDDAERLALLNLAAKQADTLQLVDAYEQLGGIALTQGRLNDGEEYWRRQLVMSAASGSSGRRLFGAQQLGYVALRYRGDPAAARAAVDTVLARQPLDSILPGDRPYDGLARFYAAAGDLPRARSLLALADSSDRQLGRTRTAERAWTRGVIALAEGRVRDAETQLRRSADTYWCAICPLPDLARAYEAAGDLDAARRTYELYLATPWLWRYQSDAVELGQVMTRLGELYEAREEGDRAVEIYIDLLDTWRRADAEAALRAAEVRNRLARLTAARR
jgi:eukaryotic-like serine/threonine-protein kinase